MPAVPGLEAGAVVSHYRIEQKLGEGGGGSVFRARDERLGRLVALKFLSARLTGDREGRERFIREARAASSLDHPNICTIFEIDETDDGTMFIAMAYYPGRTLDRLLDDGPIDPSRALGLAVQVGHGLSAAHQELIVHRDIKPGNVMVTGREVVKILDFGLAKLSKTAAITNPTAIVGTPAYMSPEQIEGGVIDRRTDIWSLGVVLYQMIAGRPPFAGDRVERVIHSVLHDEPPPCSGARPDALEPIDRIVAKALAKSPRGRWDEMDEMVEAMEHLLADLDSGAVTIRFRSPRIGRSIAVLPFADMSSSGDQQYFCDGIAEELLGALSAVPSLHVASRTSSFQYRGSSMDIREIGAKLDVSTILEGSVRRAGDRVRISAQLVDVRDGYRLWSDRYDRDMADIFAIQDEIAHNIAEALQVTLLGKDREAAPVTDVEAYDLYLQGRQFFHQHRSKGFEIARQNFLRAIEIDPGYARAYAGIANCSAFLRLYFGAGIDLVEEADRASARALELGPGLAEAHAARGLAHFLCERVDEAEEEFRRAIEIDPGLYDAYYLRARNRFSQGRMKEACADYERAASISPEAPDVWYLLGMAYRRLDLDSKARNADLSCIEAANKRLAQHPEDTRTWTMGAAVLAELGEPAKATEWVRRALAVDPDESIVLYNAACVFSRLGEIEDAIGCLDAAFGHGALNREWVTNDPDLDPLRDDPRFQGLVERLP